MIILKQLVFLSGKGGTGKTSISSAFAHLSKDAPIIKSGIIVDADVDAANLSIVLDTEINKRHDFWGGSLAEIKADMCTGCGLCAQVCRYDAVKKERNNQNLYYVDPIACDGCAACVYACPEKAISMIPQMEGYWFQSHSPYGHFFHAELFPGRENSGKLVALIRQKAKLLAEKEKANFIIIDGPPGIGCPVISASTGVDLGLIVTEPGVAAMHDLQRIHKTLQHFQIPSIICVNKADLYPDGLKNICDFAQNNNIEIVGKIPFDVKVPEAMVRGKPITKEFPDALASKAILNVWKKVTHILFDSQQ